MSKPDRNRYLNTSLAKALEVLALFDGNHREYSLADLARAMGTLSGSLYPIVYTLGQFGYLERNSATKRYRLGLRVLTQAGHLLAGLDLRDQARSHLKELARLLSANSHLAVLYDAEVLYLDRQQASPTIVLSSVVGHRVPAHCTALGKVLLAHHESTANRLLNQDSLEAVTPHTVTNPAVLAGELTQVRERGYAIDKEEFHEGNVCVAAPVRDFTDSVVAAVSASLGRMRLRDDPIQSIVDSVVRTAEDISHEMGYPRTPAP